MNPSRPVMAAALAAFSVMSSLLASAPARALVAPKTKPAQVQEETNPVNILAELIKKDKTAQADVSLRVQKLLLDPDYQGRRYIATDLPGSREGGTVPLVISDWVRDNPVAAAFVYYVARPMEGKAPAWLLKHPKGTTVFSDDEKAQAMPQRLADYLAGMGKAGTPRSYLGTVAVSGFTPALGAFLNGATEGAKIILNPSVPSTSDEARRKSEQNDNAGVNVPMAPGSGGTINAPAAGFGFADLYKTGAVHQDVSGPNDGGPRTLSVKMYTIPDGKGHFENKIGIVDITDPRVPYGPEFVALDALQDTFTLKDGGRKYSLTIDKDGAVVIKRPGGEGDAVINTSISQLEAMRLDQIASRGSVDIAGKQYYVLGQGGIKGALVFFDKKQVDGRVPGTEAVASTEVSEIAAGKTRPVQGKPDLGKIEGKPYHLEFDNDLKMWKVAPGPGDPPPAPPKDPAAGGGEPTAGKPGAPNGGQAGEAKTLADVIAVAKSQGYREPEPDGNEGFSDALKAKVHILHNPDDNLPWCFFVAPGIYTDNRWCPRPLENVGAAVSLGGFEDFIAIAYPANLQFYPFGLLTGEKNVTPVGIFKPSGMEKVLNVNLAMELLGRYGDYQAEDLSTIRNRLSSHASGKFNIEYNAVGKFVILSNQTENKTYHIWPGEEYVQKGGDTPVFENFKGPGTVVDLSFSADASLPPQMAYDATQMMKRQDISPDGGTALYVLDDAATGEKKGFIMLRTKIEGVASRSAFVQVFGSGKDAAGKDWNAIPASYHLKGYQDVDVKRSAKIGMVRNHAGTKGSIALYQASIPSEDGGNVKKKEENCVGPLVWWGVDAATALKASRNGSF